MDNEPVQLETSPSPTTAATAADGAAGAFATLDRVALAARLQHDDQGRLFDPAVRGVCLRSGRCSAEHLWRAEAFAALSGVTKLLHHSLEQRLEHLGLTVQEARALAVVRACGQPGPQMRAIAEHLQVTPRSVTAVVDSLVAAGLVERVPDPGDRRAVTVRLTPEGDRRCDEAVRLKGAVIDELLGDLEPDDLTRLRDLCYRMVLRTGEPGSAGVAGAAEGRR